MAPGFIFLFLVWAWWLPLILATAARAAEERGEGCSAKTCGNLTISDPFWITRQDTERQCGSLDYQVDCIDSTPILRSSPGTGFGFAIVNISYQESSLRVVDSIKVADLKNSSDCRIPTWNTSAKLGLPFRINSDSLNLTFYNCTKAPPAAALRVLGLVETKCRHSTFVRIGGRYDGSHSSDGYSLQGCSTTILPVLGTPGKANASSYEELMSSGFLLTWERPRQAVSIFNENNSFHVVDENLPLATGCPPPPFNISLGIGLAPFVISEANTQLLFLSSCKEPVPPAGFRRLSCGNNSFVRLGGEGELARQSVQEGIPRGCHFSVVPILGAYDGNGDDYVARMRNGFLLEWAVVSGNCPKCSASGGECRYDEQGLGFACNCSGSMRPEKCGGSRKEKVIGIACGAGAGGILILCFVFFVCHKRKRRKQDRAPSELMRSGSSMQSYSKDLELGGSPHIFTYEELEEATDGFSASRELGDGGFGTVYKGKLRDGRVVAVKRLYKNNYKRVEQFLNEVDILSRLLHQNLVTLYGCTSRSSRDLLLVYEFIPNGTVADHLHGSLAAGGGLTWPIRMNIAIETAEALAYLHAVEIIHRDVKTNNILLDSSFHVKVADFGLSRLFPLEVTHVSTVPQGTPGYVDPVYHQCYKLTDKSDVYSFGVVLVELISSKPAVDMSRSHSEINLGNMALNRIQNHEVDQLVDPELGYETDSETKGMIDLVAELAFQCLQLDRDLRPPIKEVVEVLNCIKNGECPAKKMNKNASPKEDAHLLKDSVQYSPDSVIHRFHSLSTNHSVASNASG